MNEHMDRSDIEIFENEIEEKLTIRKPKLQKSSSGYFYEDDRDVLGGFQLFKWMIYPLPTSQFFLDNWKKRPIIIKRQLVKYLKCILSLEEIDSVLRTKRLYFTTNINITTVNETNGNVTVNNPHGKATASLVWGFYSKGCNIRILYPENFFPKVHALNAALQEYFETFVGANAYLTPANSLASAPHYADTEAFILQIEGEKLWKLYAPRTKSEILPPCSREYLGQPVKEILLEAGDMMYFPRGFIHQALAVGNKNSLHITFSLFQKNTIHQLIENSIITPMNMVREKRFDENLVESVKPSDDCTSSTSKDLELESPNFSSFIQECYLENDVNDNKCLLEIKQVFRQTDSSDFDEQYSSSTTSHMIVKNPETVLRRSARKTWRTLLEEKNKVLTQRVKNRLEEGLEVRNFPGKGRGVIATQHFKQGEFVVEYIGELIDSWEAKRRELNYSQDENIGSYMFDLYYKNQHYCVDATAESEYLGRLINHSINGNLVPKTLSVDEIPRIILIAKRDIFPGQELTFDYGDRSKRSLQYHPWLAT